MGKCESCKYRAEEGGWMACDGCIHDPDLKDRYASETIADHIRAMTDEELAGLMARWFAEFVAGLYDGSYNPSDETVGEMEDILLKQLQQPYESPTGQKE